MKRCCTSTWRSRSKTRASRRRRLQATKPACVSRFRWPMHTTARRGCTSSSAMRPRRSATTANTGACSADTTNNNESGQYEDARMVSAPTTRPLMFPVDDTQSVSGLLCLPDGAQACYVLAHGAGAGMNHSFMAAMADGLAQRRIATLRYQFPYMERGSKRPDLPKLAHAAVRAAVAEAARLCPS